MIIKIWNDCITELKSYTGTGTVLVLFVVVLGFLLYEYHSKPEDEAANPLLFVLSIPGCIGLGIIRFLKLVFTSEQESKLKKWSVRIIGIVLCLFIVVISGKRIVSLQYYIKAENTMHIPNGLKETMDVILADSPQGANVLTSPGYGVYLAAYNSNLIPAYDEPVGGNVDDYPEQIREAYRQLEDKNADMKIVARAAKECDCRYIILKGNTYWPSVLLTDLGYDRIDCDANWELFRRTGGE